MGFDSCAGGGDSIDSAAPSVCRLKVLISMGVDSPGKLSMVPDGQGVFGTFMGSEALAPGGSAEAMVASDKIWVGSMRLQI